MAKNKQSNLIAIVKMLNIGFINKYIINFEIGGGYVVLANYQSLVSKFFSLAPPHLYFSINYRRNSLLGVGFLELYDFYDLPACKQEC